MSQHSRAFCTFQSAMKTFLFCMTLLPSVSCTLDACFSLILLLTCLYVRQLTSTLWCFCWQLPSCLSLPHIARNWKLRQHCGTVYGAPALHWGRLVGSVVVASGLVCSQIVISNVYLVKTAAIVAKWHQEAEKASLQEQLSRANKAEPRCHQL